MKHIITVIGNNGGSSIDPCGIPLKVSLRFEDLSLWF